MDKQKTNLEIAKFKLEFFFILLGAGRDKEASEAFGREFPYPGDEKSEKK